MDSKQISAQTDTWILACLAAGPAPMTLREIRERLWAQIPAEIRSSWKVLLVGDQVSRSLNQLAREGVVRHDKYAMRWELATRDQDMAAPPTRAVPDGEQDQLFET
ncbi:hypothetical protein LWF15_07780 [Kineosporia rhizophila]|uniref:hypothetical protein n=1 Tax=Kineosporia TaxID=49184 RepID=UPI000A89509B|nr:MULTISPECIES: hypothetical protein [Kineosporia]MCE0535407.1 hypothetical protein [Kineosporia rhizophila]GLY16811.1 hypothetical protein Kisp01_38260 [Kineosporia sp. NBRC 101677]